MPLSPLYYELNQAQHRLRKHVDRICLAELGASSAQLGAMFYLREHEPCSQAALAAAFGQDESAATGMLRRLEQGGFIRRDRDPDDRRVARVVLSETGWALLPRADALLAELNEGLYEGFSEAELDVVHRFLTSVIRRVEEGTLWAGDGA